MCVGELAELRLVELFGFAEGTRVVVRKEGPYHQWQGQIIGIEDDGYITVELADLHAQEDTEKAEVDNGLPTTLKQQFMASELELDPLEVLARRSSVSALATVFAEYTCQHCGLAVTIDMPRDIWDKLPGLPSDDEKFKLLQGDSREGGAFGALSSTDEMRMIVLNCCPICWDNEQISQLLEDEDE